MASPPAVEVVGEIVVDLVAGKDGRLTPVPGGSPANVALALARLGVPVQLRARLGADALAARCRHHLAANGVGLDLAVPAVEPATLALATVGADGAAHYDFWTAGTSDWQWSDAELADSPRPGTVALHTGSLASWMRPGRVPVLALMRRAAAGDEVTLSYDPNVRPALLGEPVRAREQVEAYLQVVHVVKASDEDVAYLYPGLDHDEVLRRWHSLGAELAVITLGGSGARGSTSAGVDVRIEAPPVRVVDTVGAGDTFMGALLAALGSLALLGDAPAARLTSLTDDALIGVLRRAAAAASVTCSREGCDPPTVDEVDAALQG